MPPVTTDEKLSRFIVDKRWIQKKDGTVRAAAFLPYTNNEVSVFRTSALSDNETWEIGQGIATSQNPSRTLRGRAELVAEDVTFLGLSVIPSEPPPHHANISGYPIEESKAELIALKLADKASFIKRD